MQPKLGFPAQVDEICGQTGQALSSLPTDTRCVTSVVRSLDQDVSDVGVAGMGDGTPMLRRAAGILAARQSGETHEGGDVGETTEVSALGRDGDRGEGPDTAQSLHRRDQTDLPAVLGTPWQILFEAPNSFFGRANSSPVVLEDNLSCGLGKCQLVSCARS